MSADEILSEVRQFRMLEQVMQWAFARVPPAELQTVITQDEFTHDIVLRLTPELFLNFDAT